jgi:hypothetical protein
VSCFAISKSAAVKPNSKMQPANSLLNVPNKISDKDFDGWVDERGTFFLRSWDPKYTALLESNEDRSFKRVGRGSGAEKPRPITRLM